MAIIDETEKVEVLEIAIRELTNKYNFYNTIHEQLRVRVLALIAAAVAGATYIYSDLGTLIPTQRYGFVIFIIATVLLGVVFFMLLQLIQTIMWESPVEVKETERCLDSYDSKLQWLQFVKDDYITAIRGNSAIVAKRAKMFNNSVYLLIISAIILLVIKGG